MQNKLWVLVADASRARLFSINKRTGPLTEIKDWIDEGSRQKIQDMVTDKPGRTFDSVGQGRHVMESNVDPKREEELRFSKFICEQLYDFFQNHGLERLHIAASPSFLGWIREHLHKNLKKKIGSETPKDLTKMDAQKIRKHLPEFL